MNLKIDKLRPYPPEISPPYQLNYVEVPAPSLLLYAPPPSPLQKPEEPKKKFAFKASSQPTVTVEPIHIFDLGSQ